MTIYFGGFLFTSEALAHLCVKAYGFGQSVVREDDGVDCASTYFMRYDLVDSPELIPIYGERDESPTYGFCRADSQSCNVASKRRTFPSTKPGRHMLITGFLHLFAGSRNSGAYDTSSTVFLRGTKNPSASSDSVSFGAMAEDHSRQGKTKYLGLTEAPASTLRRAHAVYPIAAVQVECSPFMLGIEDEKTRYRARARCCLIASSPLASRLLTGRYMSRSLILFTLETHDATAGQVALAWLHPQDFDVIPIPGSTKDANWKENLGALELKLTPDEVKEVRRLAEMVDAFVSARDSGDAHAAARGLSSSLVDVGGETG
ncbi:NADP-dependent oxidoreductase domain-containing protein [Epithele typhae]|uniref:NADP-dependent oxidoreductase domain-containing protein n=1 Tax=Epithele typhae TaxID=378194 RepID=UPI002008D6BF|nr:NADP-dependent oxidoreductase domain-containing protein [Epithele typhae]KAH9930535.1 NADP-dependent oxidoreductase domain-containing protein [Epithele typhae]